MERLSAGAAGQGGSGGSGSGDSVDVPRQNGAMGGSATGSGVGGARAEGGRGLGGSATSGIGGGVSVGGGLAADAGSSSNDAQGGVGEGGDGFVATTSGMGGSAGSTSGHAGAGGRAGAGGNAGAGLGGMAGFACDTPVVPSCDRFPSPQTFTSGDFGGGVFTYGDLHFDTANTSTFHVTGSVSTYSGFGIYFNSCTTLSAYTGVGFVLTGSIASLDHPDTVRFFTRSNADAPVDTLNHQGQCVGSPGAECVMPRLDITVSSSPRTLIWTELGGGKPVATLDPRQVIGFQWEIAPDATTVPFSVDLELDDFTLLGGGSAPTDCVP